MTEKIKVLSLASLRTAISFDPGLRAQTPASQIAMGLAAVDILNDLLISVIGATHVNDDGMLSAADMATRTGPATRRPGTLRAG